MGIFEENFEIHRSHFLLSSRILSVACSRLMLTVENRSFSAYGNSGARETISIRVQCRVEQ